MSMNAVCLVGRLTRDPDHRTTTTGKTVSNFSIAVNKRFKPQDGSPDADFFRVSAWGPTADYIANYGAKGRMIAIEGRLESRKWQDSEGNNRESVEVVASNVQFIGSNEQGQQSQSSAPTSNADEYDPFSDHNDPPPAKPTTGPAPF